MLIKRLVVRTSNPAISNPAKYQRKSPPTHPPTHHTFLIYFRRVAVFGFTAREVGETAPAAPLPPALPAAPPLFTTTPGLSANVTARVAPAWVSSGLVALGRTIGTTGAGGGVRREYSRSARRRSRYALLVSLRMAASSVWFVN